MRPGVLAEVERYTTVAPVYDLLSGEWPVYRAGRVTGIPKLQLRPGARVVDIGCGTGLNFPLLRRAVTDEGQVVGIDASPQMLRTARRRLGAARNVELVRHDATRLDELIGASGPLAGRPADAVLFTYALSLMTPWRDAWRGALSLARPGARVVIVDMAAPVGGARVFAPLARLATRLGGADIDAHPWTALQADCVDVSHAVLRGGHVQVWAGTWPGS